MTRIFFALFSIVSVAFPASPAAAQDAPAPLSEAARRMKVPEGFEVALFAGEPDVTQPIAFTTDDRGRLWVVENRSYPNWDVSMKDRILILEDRDGDGRHDVRKVFWDQGTNLSGIAHGFGGIWLCSTPNLVFVPDRNGDDVPDGPAEVVLDGWDVKARHNVFNGLAWGPDGFLYGCNGILSNSKVGPPGAPESKRVSLNCGVWKYHPTKKLFEVVSHGTTNPWGLDFDEVGEVFFTNCVISHLWHGIPGAHFERMFGQDINPNSYTLMPSIADHIHWAGGDWQSSRGGQGDHDKPGGGHAHSGAMVYLGDNWPDKYRGSLYTCNIHGNRVNRDVLERKGSGYVAKHADDVLLANDPWFRGLALQYGPDGGVFIADWSDTGECHDYEDIHRENGRIFKVTYGKPRQSPVDLAKLSDSDLVERLKHKNAWHARHASRILQERAESGKLAADVHRTLRGSIATASDPIHRLRSLWALAVSGGLTDDDIRGIYPTADEDVLTWAIRLDFQDGAPAIGKDGSLAVASASRLSPKAQIALATQLVRIPKDRRSEVVALLAKQPESPNDPNLPAMLWYALEPLASEDESAALAFLRDAKYSLTRKNLSRRIASSSNDLNRVLEIVAGLREEDRVRDVLAGVREGLLGRRRIAIPSAWPEVYQAVMKQGRGDSVREAVALGVLLGDSSALEVARKSALDRSVDALARREVIDRLVKQGDSSFDPLLPTLIGDPDVRAAAIRGLSERNHPDAARLILERYRELTDVEKREALAALSTRPALAASLLSALERGEIPRRDVTAAHVQQLFGIKDQAITARATKYWGAARPTPRERSDQIAKLKTYLTPDILAQADRPRGRAVFGRLCMSCHILFGEGNKVGPELTGSQRTNIDYVLTHVIDPNAIVGREHQLVIVETKDGRVISGISQRDDRFVLAIRTATELIPIPREDVESYRSANQSMMPEGLLNSLSNEEIRDLAGYLASPSQVPPSRP